MKFTKLQREGRYSDEHGNIYTTQKMVSLGYELPEEQPKTRAKPQPKSKSNRSAK